MLILPEYYYFVKILLKSFYLSKKLGIIRHVLLHLNDNMKYL